MHFFEINSDLVLAATVLSCCPAFFGSRAVFFWSRVCGLAAEYVSTGTARMRRGQKKPAAGVVLYCPDDQRCGVIGVGGGGSWGGWGNG